MTRLRKYIFILCLTCLSSISLGQNDSLKGLQNDIYLHPADGFTAYTLKKNELVYCQSPFTLPFPSWAWWGITDKITAEIDLLPLIGGLFQKPHLPVPSFNFRFKLIEQKKLLPSIAFETMYQYLWNENAQVDDDNLLITRAGHSWYNHFNFSWKMGKKSFLHLSAGATYSQNLLIESKDTVNPRSRNYTNGITPDLSLSFESRPISWLSYHITASYGTTFIYLDNVPRKYQLSYGFRIAPFWKLKRTIFNSFRAEFIGFYMNFPDVDEQVQSLAPIFPYFYWQWTPKKRKKKN